MSGSPRLELPRGRASVSGDGRWRRLGPDERPCVPELVRTGVLGEQGREPGGAIVEGEAAEVLRAMFETGATSCPGTPSGSLRGEVQVVYIDPPYNTGGAFAHYRDDVDHDLWLTAMRERLELLRETLAPTGSMWLHVDDAEMAYAKVLCDEVFGRRNMVSTLVVENNPKGRQLGKFFAGSHDYLLVYARDIERASISPGTAEAVNPSDFPMRDDQGRYRLLPLRNTNKKFNPATARTMHFPLWADADSGRVATHEFDGATEVWPVFGDLSPAVWRWSAARVEDRPDELLARVVRGRSGERLDVFQIDRLHERRTKKLRSIWHSAEVGSSDSAKLEVKALSPGAEIFSTPKPEPLLLRILRAASSPGDLVLDCFAGSGTTAAVAQKAGRRWIAVELSGDTVRDFLIPRLDAVVSGADLGGVSGDCDWSGGGHVAVMRTRAR